MKCVTRTVLVLLLAVMMAGCKEPKNGSATKEPKRIPPISVNNPFHNASFSWSGYNKLDQIEGTVRCSSTGIGTFGWKIYDSAGTILDDWARCPVYIKAGESKKVTLFSNDTDLSKASRIVITVNEEE